MSKCLYDIKTGVPGVRRATPADEGEILGLLTLLHAENGIFRMNRDKVIAGIQWATGGKGGIIFVIEEKSRLVATLGMLIMRDWYSDDEFLSERWNYVHPDHRRSDYARKLIEQAKWTVEWFKTEGLTVPFMCGINSFDRTEAKVRLYARHMPCIGAFFLYGQVPRQNDKVQTEMRLIEESNKRNSRERSREVRPTVETILRVGGTNHVQS